MSFWLEPFVINALIAGCLMALLAGPVGSVMLWRSMSYFGDAMSHTAILGIAAGIFLEIDFNLGVFLIVLFCAFLFTFLHEKKIAKADTLLCIIAQVGLSLGIIFMAMERIQSSTVSAFLFGDILAVTSSDLWYIGITCLMVLVLLFLIWKKLILITFDEETAAAENRHLIIYKLLFMVMVALFVSLAIKTTGILLVTALLIIPSAAARHLSATPEAMAVQASVIGIAGVISGLFLSFSFDFPTGPAIVTACAALGLVSFIFKKK